MNKRKKTLIQPGFKSGKLTVIARSSRKREASGNYYYVCQCECGNKKEVLGPNLTKARATESCGCLTKKAPGEVSYNQIILTYKNGAKYRGITFDLTKDQIKTIISQACHYCGFKGRTFNKYMSRGQIKDLTVSQAGIDRSWITANGIDRKNNTLGYTIDNCVPCCEYCNLAKRDLPYEIFTSYIKQLVNFNG